MGDTAALERRLRLGRPDPAPLRQRDVSLRTEVRVLRLRRHRPRLRLDHQIRRAEHALESELVFVRPFAGGGRSVGFPARRAGVDPADDGVDLLVAQRRVVDELLDADRLVEMPRRHLARGHARPDRARPRPRVVVGDQRHRADAARAMAHLTLVLEDRRDVLAERHLGARGALCARRIRRRYGEASCEGPDANHLPKTEPRHDRLLSPSRDRHGKTLYFSRILTARSSFSDDAPAALFTARGSATRS